jgi:hypothetical protein
MNEISPDAWIKASASASNGNCVELATLPNGDVLVRDSKNPTGGCLVFRPVEIAAFFDGVRSGEFDHLAGGRS